MNDKIKKLAEEAGAQLNSGMHGGPRMELIGDAAIEKFALLITKACADAADMGLRATPYIGDYVVESMDFTMSDRIDE